MLAVMLKKSLLKMLAIDLIGALRGYTIFTLQMYRFRHQGIALGIIITQG